MDSGTVVDKVNDTILKNRAYYPFSDFDTGRHKGVELLSINELAGWLYTSGTGNKGLKCANIMRQRKGPNTIKVSGIRIGDLLNKPMIDVEYPCHGWSGECMFTGNCALNEGLYLREEQQKRIIDVVLNLTSGNPFFYREVPDLERGDLERWENVWFID